MSEINKINQIDISNINKVNSNSNIDKINSMIFSNNNLNIGDFYQGGYYFGNIDVGEITYGLLCSPSDGEAFLKYRLTFSGGVDGTESLNDGYSNTQAILLSGTITNHPVAEFCINLNINSYTDWYVPARYELNLLRENRTILENNGCIITDDRQWSSSRSASLPNNVWVQYFPTGAENDNYGATNTFYVRTIRRFVI